MLSRCFRDRWEASWESKQRHRANCVSAQTSGHACNEPRESMRKRILFEASTTADAVTSNKTSCDLDSAVRTWKNQNWKNQKKWSLSSFLVLFHFAIFLAPLQCVWGQVSVLTWHYDKQVSGLNQSETLLTPANVNSKSFAKL